MFKHFYLFFLLNIFSLSLIAQDQVYIDSLENELKHCEAFRLEMGEEAGKVKDTLEADILRNIGAEYVYVDPEKAIGYFTKSLALSTKANYKKGIASAHKNLGVCYTNIGDYPSGLTHHFSALEINKQLKDSKGIASAYNNLGNIYSYQGDFPTALNYFLQALKIRQEIGDKKGIAASYNNIGSIYGFQGNFQEALRYQQESIKIKAEIGDRAGLASSYINIGKLYFDQNKHREALRYFTNSMEIAVELKDRPAKAIAYNNLGSVYGAMGEYDEALKNFIESVRLKEETGNAKDVAATYINIGSVYLKKGNLKEALIYEQNGLELATQIGSLPDMTDATEKISQIYAAMNNFKTAYEYSTLFKRFNDSLFNSEENRKITELQMQHEFSLKQSEEKANQDKKDLLQQEELKKQRIIRNASISGVLALAVFIIILFRRITEKKKNNLALSEANETLQAAMENLKTTRSQLEQSEKMALLGQLTSGIAHEIRNPLNFVNNFSEVSQELLDDFDTAQTEEERKNIADILKKNLSKILEHGKRADHIVETMLEHNNSGSGEKVLTDINSLCEEDIALAYYSLRANKNNFNCTIRKDLVQDLPKLKIIPQDIHRVLVNVFNNAFDSLIDKQKKDPTFLPELTISTQHSGNSVEIIVRDNGEGIPAGIMDKIFQPFFTTKPAGQGTGLGLSLCYDLIRAHNGTIEITSEQGKGTEVHISLPIGK
ncbi:MAG: tetratricopeptide repeat-containing sensor histidine kinase [Bacteroidetes bacterium]|nr:tetratricopeptide repeat-containing sensor histidine kinase [Bacteroidota bacterium]